MLCKKCNGSVEPQYQTMGLCENCSANEWQGLDGNWDKFDSKGRRSKLFLNLFLSDLKLDTRLFNALYDAGLSTVEDLVNCTESQLRQIKFIKTHSISVIKAELSKLGLELKPEPSSLPLPIIAQPFLQITQQAQH